MGPASTKSQVQNKMAKATEQQASAAAPVEENKGEKAVSKEQEPETTTPEEPEVLNGKNGHVAEEEAADAVEDAEDEVEDAEDDEDVEDEGEEEEDEPEDAEENPLKRKVEAEDECLKKKKVEDEETEAAVEA